jgi:hypothetical protein
MTRVARSLAAALFFAAMLVAAEPVPARSCATAPGGELDFLIGNWLVTDSSGHAIGTTTIRKACSGCALIERWRGTGRSDEGLGVIGYDPAAGRWHREFLDRRGFVLALDGRREGPTIVMTGNDYEHDVARMNRVTWAALRDGTVVQRWQTSTDGGRSWQPRFHALLRRIAE